MSKYMSVSVCVCVCVCDIILYLHRWQRVTNLYFIKTPSPCIAFPLSPFFKFGPLPTALFLALFLWLNVWSRQIYCFLLNVMDLNLSILHTLVPAAPICVFYGTRNQIYRSFDTYNIVSATTLIWYHITYKHTQDTQGPIDWHTCRNIY